MSRFSFISYAHCAGVLVELTTLYFSAASIVRANIEGGIGENVIPARIAVLTSRGGLQRSPVNVFCFAFFGLAIRGTYVAGCKKAVLLLLHVCLSVLSCVLRSCTYAYMSTCVRLVLYVFIRSRSTCSEGFLPFCCVCTTMVVHFTRVYPFVFREVFAWLRPLTPHSILAAGFRQWTAYCRDAFALCAACAEFWSLTVQWRVTCTRYLRAWMSTRNTTFVRDQRFPQLAKILVSPPMFDRILREFSLESFPGHPDCNVSILQVVFATWPCAAKFAKSCDSAMLISRTEESFIESVGRIVFPDFQWAEGARPLGWNHLRSAFAFCQDLCEKVHRIPFEDDALKLLDDALRFPPEGKGISNVAMLKRLFRAVRATGAY